LTWDIGALAASDGRTVSVDTPVAAGTTEFVNVAVANDDWTNGADPTPDNNRDSDRDTYGADVSITKDDGRTVLTPGEQVTYTLVVTNLGPSDVTEVIVTDAAPPALSDLTFAATTGSFDPATGEWTGLALAPGDSAELEVTATVDAAATGRLTNTATVALPAGFTDPTPANNQDSDTDRLVSTTDVTIDKEGPATAEQGSEITYSLTVANAGPSEATDVVIIDDVPAGLTWLSSSGSGWTCSGTTRVECELDGSLSPGGGSVLELTLSVTASAGEVVNHAEVQAAGCNCDDDTAATTITPSGVGPDDDGDDDSGIDLPGTGGIPLYWLLLGLALLLAGIVTLMVTRNRQHAEDFSDDGPPDSWS
jgi:uncharacterized repeat protein (TIGR01451 family)